jgi:hypothetical protein
MKIKLITSALGFALGVAIPLHAAEIPASITTPDKVETASAHLNSRTAHQARRPSPRSTMTSTSRTLSAHSRTPFSHGWRWIVDAHRDGRRYIVESDELLSAFLELERRSCNPGK